MIQATLTLAAGDEIAQLETTHTSFVSKKLTFYILSAPARCWLNGVRLAASDVTATVRRLAVSPRSKNRTTERSFRYGSRIPYVAPLALCCTVGRDGVLDPFGGAGTTGLVADRLSRSALLIELNPDYAQLARDRIKNDNPLFTDVA